MAKNCTSCGNSYEDSAYPASPSIGSEDGDTAGTTCNSCCEKKSTRKRRRKVYVPPSSCAVVPTGINPCEPACNPCSESSKTNIVYRSPETCLTKGGVDEYGLELFENKKKVGIPSAGQCYPFTKDSFARIGRTIYFPKIGSKVATEIVNVVLADGQPITHPEYGTLIAHPILGQPNQYYLENIESANNGLDVIGKPIPCGKEFYFGYPRCECSVDDLLTLECNSLLEDFVVPAVESTVEVVVRSYLDINIDDLVVIRNQVDPHLAYTYRVSGATGSNTLILENQGDGGPVGTTIGAASDVEGEYAWCVALLLDQSPCAVSTETTCILHLLGCNEDGNGRKISGHIENEALLFDPACGGWTPKVVAKPIVCVLLDSCFQVSPVTDICNTVPVTITTLDDQKLLDSAAAALLSDLAEPLITICGYVFSLNLTDSVVGALKVTPVFNPEEITNFDKNCKVCIPEDCCFQCAPQVSYPVEEYFTPGLNLAGYVIIPAALFSTFGEYKLSMARNPASGNLILLVHDNTTNEVTAAYDSVGVAIDLGTLTGDPDEYTYNTFDYCNDESTCPVDAQYEEDINLRFYDLVAGEEVSFNFHSQIDVYSCINVGVEGEALTSTQYGIMGHFRGPSQRSYVATGEEPWGQVVPEGGFKPYDAYSGYKKRNFGLFYNTCVRVNTVATILVSYAEIWTPNSDDWKYVASNEIDVGADVPDRYTVGDVLRFQQETGDQIEVTVSALNTTTIGVTGGTVANEKIYDQFQRTLPKLKLVQIETTSMFRTQIV